MYKVIIDKDFFTFDSSLSEGLISGLKNLSTKGLVIEVEGFGTDKNEIFSRILASENIQILNKKAVKENFTKTFKIKLNREKSLPKVDYEVIFVSKNDAVDTFGKAASKLIGFLRSSSQERNTKETKIKVSVLLDGEGKAEISTGVGFFDHMLEQIAKHANLNLFINVEGDLFVDEHHTVEDTGITLGMAINEALGNKRGIKRYGFFLPMDESVAKCTIDLGGRNLLNFKCRFSREKVGDFPTELTEEFFRGLASGLKANIYLRAKGKNDHHKIEAMFKAFAKALNEACRIDERNQNSLPSTKGIL